MLTVIDAAHRLGISPSTVRQQIRNGKLRAEKYGTVWLLLPRDVERYRVQSLREQAAAAEQSA